MRKLIFYWLPVFLWAGLIFYLSNVPGLNSGLAIFWDVFWRKLAHALEFAILNFLVFRALRGYGLGFYQALFWGLFLAIFYAFSDEAHQYFVLEREARLRDVGIDSLGVILASGFLFLLRKNKQRLIRVLNLTPKIREQKNTE